MLFEGLFRSGSDGFIENGLCESFIISSDKQTYTFRIKKNFWSDGSPLTAFDFENTWLSLLDPQFPSSYGYLFFSIKNAKNYKLGLCEKHEVGIKALNHNVLQVTLNMPKSDFLELLSFSAFFPYKLSPTGFLSNGPFLFSKHVLHDEIFLIKNPRYHDHLKVSSPAISIKILDSESTALRMFKEKKLDLIGGPLLTIPYEETLIPLCCFNTNSKYFQNQNLRKAFCLAIDFQSLEKLSPLTKSKISSFLPFEHKSVIGFVQSKEKALGYLEKALNELNIKKEELSNLTYYFGGKPEHSKLAQILYDSWKKILDIDVKLMKLEHKMLASKIAYKEFDMAQIVWLAPYNSPCALLDRFSDDSLSKNFSSFSNNELSFLIKKLEKEPDECDQLLKSIDDLLFNHMPFIPLSHWSYPYYTSSRIKEVCFTNLGTINYTFLKIHEDSCSLPPLSGI
jgi:oligopeptide transport system substrate-binding protein